MFSLFISLMLSVIPYSSINLSTGRSNAESFEDQPKVEKLYLKKKGIGSEARAERMANTDSDFQLLGNAERERELQKQKRRRRQGHEDDVCHYISIGLI